MKENYIKENVTPQVKILYQFTLQINPIKFITKIFGGVINGMQWIIEWI
jgi:hypothetical protein